MIHLFLSLLGLQLQHPSGHSGTAPGRALSGAPPPTKDFTAKMEFDSILILPLEFIRMPDAQEPGNDMQNALCGAPVMDVSYMPIWSWRSGTPPTPHPQVG